MIKTTIKQITQGMMGLEPLMTAKLPIKAKYAVTKLGRAMSAELEAYNKARETLFTEAGCRIDGDKYAHDDQAILDKCVKEANDLMDAEVEINALELDLEQFGNVEVEGPAFLGLDWAIKA